MTPDPKQGEREYFARIGPEGVRHSTLKPFGDDNCATNLANLDAIFHFLAPPPARIVEFGCGVGWLSLLLGRRGYDVIGIDISPEAIAAANRDRDARDLANVTFEIGDYEAPSSAANCDYALFYDSLHHAEAEQLAIQRAYEALKPGGMMIAFETSVGHSETAVSRRAVREFGVHEKDMTVDYIAQLGAKAGFRRHLILPRPHHLVRSLYRPSYSRGTGARDLRFRLFLSKLRVIRRLFRSSEEKFIVLWK